MGTEVKKAKGLWGLLLKATGFDYIAVDDRVYYKEHPPTESKLQEELVHIKDQKEDTLLGYFCTWMYQLITKGYKNITYEKEAHHYGETK